MTISHLGKRERTASSESGSVRPHVATLVMVGTVLLLGGIGSAWLLGHPTISQLFSALYAVQKEPPLGLEVPFTETDLLLAPTIGLVLIVFGVMQLSPTPQPWSRWVIAPILLALTTRYVLWRSLSTLNLSTPLSGVLSLTLLGFELMMITTSILQFVLLFRVRDRRREADGLSQDVEAGRYVPSVDVFIPTFDEPEFILRRTVIGCQAMDYPNKTVYLLDDTRRPEVRALARELGCRYLARSDNRFAKAGNLNHAIAQTSGDLITVFDADFIPTRNFLTRTLGFFQRPHVALVQTPQSFYNIDPIARNLGLERALTPEEEVFYRHIQPLRDGAGGVICAGTSFVVRRSALEAVGGFVTDSLSEDYFTGIRLSAAGYQLIYLDEKLSAGLAAENMAAHAMQRIRWAQGTLQAFFISANPLTIPGLTLMQRIAHLEGLLNWFTIIARAFMLFIPLSYAFLGVIPFQTTTAELVYFFLPYYLVQLCLFSWLNGRSRSAFLSDVYSVLLCLPLSVVVIQAMLRPFGKGFKVTPKGVTHRHFLFNWSLIWPLAVVFALTVLSLLLVLAGKVDPLGFSAVSTGLNDADPFGLGWFWSIYNLVVVGIALLALIDAPRPSRSEWFDLRRTVKLQCYLAADQDAALAEAYGELALTAAPTPQAIACERKKGTTVLVADEESRRKAQLAPALVWGMTTMISEDAVEIQLTQPGFSMMRSGGHIAVTVSLLEERLSLPGYVTHYSDAGEYPVVRVQFRQKTLRQHRKLVELLFCRPGQWKQVQAPGEVRSLFYMAQALLRPRILFGRSLEVSAMSVHKG